LKLKLISTLSLM